MLLFSKVKYLGNLFVVEGPGIASNGTSYLKNFLGLILQRFGQRSQLFA